MSARDNFSAKTVRTLAARVGHHCSNPDCISSTSGPAVDEGGTVSIGVGAHITAAARGGPRYDDKLTPAERSSGANGIWLCQSCSKLIDSDEQRHTVALLHQWKKDAEQQAIKAIASGRRLGGIEPDKTLDDADRQFLRGLDLPSTDALDAVGDRLRAAARTDIQAFRAARGRPPHTIGLTLHMDGSGTGNVMQEAIARLTALADPIAIVAPGGTGKSTTVIQIAEKMISTNGAIPLLIPLGEWSNRQEDFFDSALRRNAFGMFRRQHLMQLAYHGRLALLLDGWNELNSDARLRAISDLTSLQREFPQLGLVVSSRRQALPFDGPTVIIEPLSHSQQIEIAKSRRDGNGVEILDRAWRAPGIRELVGIPLYLNALLTLPSDTPFPDTKEAVLRLFVRHSEAAPDKRERLRRDTLGQQALLLTGLAVEANRTANTAIADSDARRTVSAVMQQLSKDGQIGALPHPQLVIDGLVNAHLLVRSPEAVSFQHQLFQEWYAAAEVEKLMLGAAAGDRHARKKLREDILNWLSWEESILFACDRLSRANPAGANAVTAAINETLGIDPLLAAMMLDRSAEPVWQLARDRVLRFVRRWHTAGSLDRAVRFMVTTGKPEFAEMIWPLASADEPTQYDFFRTADTFRPSVLGPDAEARLRALTARRREVALVEIASNSGFDGIELATKLASTDPDPEVVVGVIDALAYRRADRHIDLIMHKAADRTWETIAKKGYPEHFLDPQLEARLIAARAGVRSSEQSPAQLLQWLVHEKSGNVESAIEEVIATAAPGSRDVDFENAFINAHLRYPNAVAAGLVRRIVADLPIPYRGRDYLEDAPLLDTGPILDVVLDPDTDDRRVIAAAGVVGPITVKRIIKQLTALDDQIRALNKYDKVSSERHNRLTTILRATRQTALLPALIESGHTDVPSHIALLADILAYHGIDGYDGRSAIGVEYRIEIRDLVRSWIEALLAAPTSDRHFYSHVARAIARIADPVLAEPLYRLLKRDLVEQAAALAARKRGQASIDIGDYGRSYAHAFAAMHDTAAVNILKQGLRDLRWGSDAASALYSIWMADHVVEKDMRLVGWTDYPHHVARRAERAISTPATSDIAEEIFAVVDELSTSSKSDSEQRHAIVLAGTALGLPHGNKRRSIDALLALPQPIALKHRLLSSAARAGEILPARLLMEGVQDLLEASRTQSWRLDENRGELMGWLVLFPFSDEPEMVHNALSLVPPRRRQPDQLRYLLSAISQSPAATGLVTLQKLATNDPTFFKQFEWRDALVKLGSENAAFALLEYICSDNFAFEDPFGWSRALATAARKYPAVGAMIGDRYRTSGNGRTLRILELAMVEFMDEELFMAVFERNAETPTPNRSFVREAARNLAIGRTPSQEWVGSFEEFGLPLTNLRAQLFKMLAAKDARADLAKYSLIAIEECRDERGKVISEPRHPDISSDRAWPLEADDGAAE